MEKTTKKAVIIGVGNCGSQVANLAEKRYDTLFDTIYINTSDSDLAMVESTTGLKFKIGKSDVEGSGKNRLKMKEYLQEDIQKVLGDERLSSCVVDKKYCFIIASAAGGTGSGAAPVLLEIMRQLFPDTNFILVTVLPQIKASLMEQGNTIEFLKELYEVLGDKTTYMVYDNETVAELPPTQALEIVNENIVEDLRVLTGIDNYATPYESIDDADMESIITTPGRLLVARVTKNLTEKAMEDNSIDDILIKTIKKSAQCETDRNKKVLRWGIITYFTEAVNSLYSPAFETLQGFIGTPIERFNHNAINPNSEQLNFMYLVASGLSPINDRTKKINERIDTLKAALASDDASKFILSGESSGYDVMSERKKQAKKNANASEIDPASIFKKFM